MSEYLIKKAADSAGIYYKEGFNCAESIFLSLRSFAAPDLSEDMVRLATPFGGGVGRSGCVCGALSGAVIIIGAVKGRVLPDRKSRDLAYELSGEFHNRFKAMFGATCCRVLIKNESKGQGEKCHKIITESAGLLMSLLIEKNLIDSTHFSEE